MSEQTVTLEDQVRMALVRGYCTPENSHKEMDSTLVNAMAEEVVKIITNKIPQPKSCEGCEWISSRGAICDHCADFSHFEARKK